MNLFVKSFEPRAVPDVVEWIRDNCCQSFEAWLNTECGITRKIEASDTKLHIRLMMFLQPDIKLIVRFASEDDAALCMLKWQ